MLSFNKRGQRMKYKEEIIRAMNWLGEKKDTLFLGQSVRFPGTGLFWTIEGVPDEKKVELPIFEDTQMGMSLGMALEGYTPVSIYPRCDFLILAYNQLMNHLDLMEEMSDGQFKPKVIIRTAIGSTKPLFPGPQHQKDHSVLLDKFLTNVKVVVLRDKRMIFDAYKQAYEGEGSTILIEIPDLYET